MKKSLQIVINLAAFCFVCGYALVCSAQQPIVGGYKSVAADDEQVVAAANFAVSNRRETQKSASLKLLSVGRAERQIVQGTNYSLCLKVSEADKEMEVKATVYQNLQQQYTLSNWTAEKCSSPESANIKPNALSGLPALQRDFSGVWDYGGDGNKFIVKGSQIQRVITEAAESSKDFDVKAGDIDFVGIIEGNVIKGSQTLYLNSEACSHCPGLFSTKIKAELTFSDDGKTLNILRDDPFFNWDICQWTYEGRPRVVEQMNRK